MPSLTDDSLKVVAQRPVPRSQVPYDLLVVAVGEQPATFGVPGVSEHCYFMKEINDTVAIRNRIGQ